MSSSLGSQHTDSIDRIIIIIKNIEKKKKAGGKNIASCLYIIKKKEKAINHTDCYQNMA